MSAETLYLWSNKLKQLGKNSLEEIEEKKYLAEIWRRNIKWHQQEELNQIKFEEKDDSKFDII